MILFKKIRLQRNLSKFWAQVNRNEERDFNQTSYLKDPATFPRQLSDIFRSSGLSLSEIDSYKHVWKPLLNLVASTHFKDHILDLLAVALQHGATVDQKVALHVADKMDQYQVIRSSSTELFPSDIFVDTSFTNAKGLKKFLDLLTAFNAPWTTPYQYEGQTITVAQYLANKVINNEDRYGGPPTQVFQEFFKKYANGHVIQPLTADAILNKRREELFANQPDVINIITDDATKQPQQDTDVKPSIHQSKMHF